MRNEIEVQHYDKIIRPTGIKTRIEVEQLPLKRKKTQMYNEHKVSDQPKHKELDSVTQFYSSANGWITDDVSRSEM